MGRNASILYNDPNDRELLISALRKEGKGRNLEMLFKKKSGELYDASFNADFIFDFGHLSCIFLHQQGAQSCPF